MKIEIRPTKVTTTEIRGLTVGVVTLRITKDGGELIRELDLLASPAFGMGDAVVIDIPDREIAIEEILGVVGEGREVR